MGHKRTAAGFLGTLALFDALVGLLTGGERRQ